ncbi:unnamed protein product [Ceutorhynchus assimilis]|uniref:Protein MMS22-like n=1 Tax=Ceutorhynchus assimilis TaxID=467358 RepID=A0A9N9MC14_9CUCU|nr:unnamed protein product [Ceutorhynchus assimilis]
MSKNVLFQCNKRTPINLLSTQNPSPLNSHKIGEHFYNNIEITEDNKVIVRLMRSRWFCIQDAVLNNLNIPLEDLQSSREFINEAFAAIVYNKLSLQTLKTFTSTIVPIEQLSDIILRKLIFSTQELSPYYIYLHTLLEINYYITLLSPDEKQLEYLFKNILPLYKATCNCMQHFWLSIQLLIEKSDTEKFWKIFNQTLANEDPFIALSHLKELATIQKFQDVGPKSNRIQPNYDFLELKFKQLLNGATSDQLTTSFKLIEPLVCELWLKEGKLDLYQTVWDFYSKRLNVSNKNCQNLTALGFIETLDTITYNPKDCLEDFEIFVGLLVFHLKEFPIHWGKMKGRIYSQLGPNKVKDLTEIGIRHVMVLFLALSSIQFEDVEKKMLGFLDGLPKEKKMSGLIWNMYAAVILKYVREDHSVEKPARAMLPLLHEASTNQKQFHLIKDFVVNLESIITNSSNMRLHQWQLFGVWLGKYQSTCYHPDLIHSLKVIQLLLDKCSDPDSWPCWEWFFKDIVFGNLKQLALKPNAPAIIGKLAAQLTLSYSNSANKAFEFFNDEAISPSLSSMFLKVILDSYPDKLILTSQQERIIMQSWIRLCFLNVDAQIELTLSVIRLDIFPRGLKSCLESTNKEPIEAFIEYLNESFCQAISMQGKNDAIDLCNLAFGNLSTLGKFLLVAPNEQIVLKIYKYCSLLFINCGKLIYNPHKADNLLTKLIDVLFLPMDFSLGKRALHSYVLNAIKFYFTTFFQALINLSKPNKDPYLERILKALIINYLPQFPILNSPIVQALDDSYMAPIVLEKICLGFFKPPMKESDTPNLLKALKIVSDVANSTTSLELFKNLINTTLFGLFEVVIFHSQRSSAIGVIKQITNSPLFRQVGPEFRQLVSEVTAKHIGFNTINYFQLMMCLGRFVPSEIRAVLGDVKSQMVKVERLRGVGYDQTLRVQLDKLEKSLQ